MSLASIVAGIAALLHVHLPHPCFVEGSMFEGAGGYVDGSTDYQGGRDYGGGGPESNYGAGYARGWADSPQGNRESGPATGFSQDASYGGFGWGGGNAGAGADGGHPHDGGH